MKKVAVGVDIGGTNSVYGLVDDQGHILSEGVFPTRNYPDSDLYIEELYIGIQNLLKAAGDEVELVGVGIGAPNGNYYRGTIENAPNLPWKGPISVVEKMKRFFPTLPVILTNDANAAAVGEMIYGGAKGMKDFLVVTLGTGLGSGFVANGSTDIPDSPASWGTLRSATPAASAAAAARGVWKPTSRRPASSGRYSS